MGRFLALSVVVVLGGCAPVVFSGALQVEVLGPPEAAVGLFNHPAAGIEAQQVSVIAERLSCEVFSTFASGATTPRQVFAVEEGPFTIAFDESLPAVPLSLVAWIDLDGDAELDFVLNEEVEGCAAPVHEFERGPIAITQIDALGDGRFRVLGEDGAEIGDENASGWTFSL